MMDGQEARGVEDSGPDRTPPLAGESVGDRPASDGGDPPPGHTRHVSETLRGEMTKRFVADAAGGLAGHPVAGVVTLILFWDHLGARPALFWFGGLLLATAARFFLSRRAARLLPDTDRARRQVFVGVVLVGLAWAVGGVLFGITVPREELGILLVIMAGLVAAATATLVADRASFYAFANLLLGSVLLSVLYRGEEGLSLLLSALVLTFWLVMSALHKRANGQLEESLSIRRQLKAAQEQYESLVESARDLVWRVDDQGRWTFLNAACREIYGAEAEDLLGTSSLDRAHPDHRERDYAAFARLLMGSELVDHETVHLAEDGQPRHLSFSARPLKGASGRVQGAQGTARDVTDRVNVREALAEVAEKNSLVRSLINGTEDLIFYKDANGVYQGCNHRFASFLGKSEEDIVGKTDADLIGPERARSYQASDHEALTSWDALKFEEWMEDGEGNRRLMETVKTVFRHSGGDTLGILGVVRDVTERKEAEDRMRELAERAERATRMKSAFLANMSHEIRTPMNGVLGMTEILLETDLTEEQKRSLEIIRSSGESLLGVLNDILDISKIESGHLELEEVTFDLHDAVMGSAHLFMQKAAKQGSELVVDLKPDVPKGVVGDPTRLRQVLSNLVGNAVKFTKEGEIVVSVSLAGAADGPDGIRFSVKDTGMGIPKEKQQAIFQEFTQADSSTTREFGGTGLGLTISRHLVSLMGGSLELESEVGVGSDFFFTIPLPTDPAFVPDREPVPAASLAGIRTLVVDDLETNRRIFKDFLEGAGSRVDVAESASKAVHLLKEAPVDDPYRLVFLDLLMPGKDGFHLAEDIRLDPDLRDLPLVILTSSSQPGDRKRANRLRVNGFLNKPVSRRDLLDIAASVLASSSSDGLSPAGGEPPAGPAGIDDPRGERTDSQRSVPDRDAAGPGAGGAASSGIRVLVAEDNKVNQQVAMGLLRQWGHEVRLAGTGREALEILEEWTPDVILMDVQMPELDGIEATGRIRTDPRFAYLPIVALTAHVLPEERERCKKAGMDGYLPKPFKPAELKEQVSYWAQESRTRKSSEDGAQAPSSPEPEPGSHASAAATETTPGEPPPVLIEEFIAVMREAGIESVVEPAIEAYLEETPKRMTALEEAVKRGDWTGVESEAHGMKSGSRNIRADALGDLLELVERAGSEGREAEVRENLPLVRDAYQKVMRFLQERGSSS